MDTHIAIVSKSHPLASTKKGGIKALEYHPSLDQDAKIHQWLLDGLKPADVEVKGFYVDVHLGGSLSAYLGFRLAIHIRITEELGPKRFLPIVIMGMDRLLVNIIEDQAEKTALIALTPGTRYAPDWAFAQSAMQNLKPLSPEVFNEQVLNQLILSRPPEYLSNHSITNQWGAYRLDWAANNKVLDANNQPAFKELYFKYLLAKGSQSPVAALKVKGQIDLNPPIIKGTGKRILFIDDEADKGWAVVLEAIFEQHDFVSVGKNRDDTEADFLHRATEQLHQEWDLILLDLRLTEKDHQPDILEFQGAHLLKQAKEFNRATSVIMFTASTQAMNYESLIEAGADGYFVKEGIEHAADYNFSRKNYERFCETVNHCLYKSETLKPFWTQVDRIERGLIPTLVAHDGIRARIQERLRMFFGLLKKSFELTSYDQDTFFYSAQELAFVTLWSVLNEVEHAFIQKGEGNKPDMTHVGTGKIFMEGDHSHMKISDRYPCLLESPEVCTDRKGRHIDMRQQLYRATQFILLNHAAFQQLPTQKQEQLLKRVESINRLRNKLYLIHGDDGNQSFFDYTQQQKREEYQYYDNILQLNSFWLLQILGIVLLDDNEIPEEPDLPTLAVGDEFECTISRLSADSCIAYVSMELVDQTASIHIDDIEPRPSQIDDEFEVGEVLWLRIKRIIPERIELETPY